MVVLGEVHFLMSEVPLYLYTGFVLAPKMTDRYHEPRPSTLGKAGVPHSGLPRDFLTTRDWIIHSPYGRQYRRDIGRFLRISYGTFDPFRAELCDTDRVRKRGRKREREQVRESERELFFS